MEALLLAHGPALHRAVLREIRPQCHLLVGIQRKQMQVVAPYSGASVYLPDVGAEISALASIHLEICTEGVLWGIGEGSGGEGCYGERGGGP